MTPGEDHADLIEVDILKAMRAKFERGRERHGHGEWVGPPPLVCAHDEALDLLVYLDQESRNAGEDEVMVELMRKTLDLIQGVRTALRIRMPQRVEPPHSADCGLVSPTGKPD